MSTCLCHVFLVQAILFCLKTQRQFSHKKLPHTHRSLAHKHQLASERFGTAFLKIVISIIILQSSQRIEVYGNSSICVDGVRSLSSDSCGTYIWKPAMPLCLAQETYTVNGSNHYAIQLEGMCYVLGFCNGNQCGLSR